ncbi:hypothetical protein [Candidatus Poriferisodalis sp.]|uniref:hypothetical protein n=1 Tax=Candidatus Poriferisodalis sp. TaxID=3101277 RepID=UPI003B5C979B
MEQFAHELEIRMHSADDDLRTLRSQVPGARGRDSDSAVMLMQQIASAYEPELLLGYPRSQVELCRVALLEHCLSGFLVTASLQYPPERFEVLRVAACKRQN